jgi:stalled ribosome rescue protein Dom34
MTTFHAIVWIDHSEAHVLLFDREHVEAQRVKARSHLTLKHGKAGADTHFYDQVARALADVREVLVTGPGSAKNEWREHCRQHAPLVDKAVVDVVSSDHPSDAQLVAMARTYFLKFDQAAADPTQR